MMNENNKLIKPLWKPTKEIIETSHCTKFISFINSKYNLNILDFHMLWEWSISELSDFWESIWQYTDIISSKPYTQIIQKSIRFQDCRFFIGSKLNVAENYLKFRDNRNAIIFQGETSDQTKTITYNELYDQVKDLFITLKEKGIQINDRIAGYLPNIPETIISMLATTSIGAIWSCCSPDFGKRAVLDRFEQIRPKVLFTVDGYFYKGKIINILSKIKEIVDELPSLEYVIIFPYTMNIKDNELIHSIRNGIYYEDFIQISNSIKKNIKDILFEQLPFDHPIYIMYSSGTTGKPKCLVQGPGVLLNHLKELIIHLNASRDDVIFYFTTTGWMMWNWLISGLAVGSTIVLFDGNPLYPNPSTLWDIAQKLNITIFGTSAKYLSTLNESNYIPNKYYPLEKLRLILSTGSPASSNIFKYIYSNIKSNVQFSSISGGTDLNGCFALGCINLSVYDSELQCRGLGLNVQIFNKNGEIIHNEKGELVCSDPFPSMPLYFWDDSNGQKYLNAYFNIYDNIWRHGDYAKITENNGLIIYGRSDATLKPGGVRIGTSDIYRILDEEIKEIKDSLVIGQEYILPDGISKDIRILLFIKLNKDICIQLTDQLINNIKNKIRQMESPRHVPESIIECPDIPYTLNGKKVEIPIKKIMEGNKINDINIGALKNIECLYWFEDFYTKEFKK